MNEKFKKAVIVGTVRNAERNVCNDVRRIIGAFENHLEVLCLVVESDSSDKTLEELDKYSKVENRFSYITLGDVAPEIPDRIERLRHCRNVYVEAIRNESRYSDADLIIVADLDGINKEINAKAVFEALHCQADWDMLGANQRAKYYDILALRHETWSPKNWLVEYDWLKGFVGEHKAKRHSLSDRMIRIPRHSDPILVDSAFGGLSIYKRWVFDISDYSRDNPESLNEIDHVTFNRKARNHGAKIYVFPKLINANWTIHSLNGTRSILNFRRILEFLNYLGYRKIRTKIKSIVS